jgi:hypothetical protein
MGSPNEIEPEKPTVTSTIETMPSSSQLSEEESIRRQPDRDVRNALWAIITGIALPCVPIVAILAVLLYFRFHYHIQPWEGYAELALNTTVTGTQRV